MDGSLASAADVARRLRASPYWTGHDAALKLWIAPTNIEARIQRWSQKLQEELACDAWLRLQTFSGKEIFRYLRSHVRGLDETPVRPPNPSSAVRDLNLGMRIARKVLEMRRVPPKLTELRQILRTKAGL